MFHFDLRHVANESSSLVEKVLLGVINKQHVNVMVEQRIVWVRLTLPGAAVCNFHPLIEQVRQYLANGIA